MTRAGIRHTLSALEEKKAREVRSIVIIRETIRAIEPDAEMMEVYWLPKLKELEDDNRISDQWIDKLQTMTATDDIYFGSPEWELNVIVENHQVQRGVAESTIQKIMATLQDNPTHEDRASLERDLAECQGYIRRCDILLAAIEQRKMSTEPPENRIG